MTGITIKRRSVIIHRHSYPVTVVRRENVIKVTAGMAVKQTFKPFYLIATQDQRVFVLPGDCAVNGMLSLAVNGFSKSQIKGDFTVLGNVLTLDLACDENDEISGVFSQQ